MKQLEGPWRASITNPEGRPATTRAEAEAVCRDLNWTVESPEDEENGIWLVSIPEGDARIVAKNGTLGLIAKHGEATVEAP